MKNIVRQFRFIWTGLEFNKIPKNLEEDVLYILKSPVSLQSKSKYAVCWSEQGELASQKVNFDVLQQLPFIQFPKKNTEILFQQLKETEAKQLMTVLSPLCLFSLEDIPLIYQGPRQKTAATQHLEFILKSYIFDSKSIKVQLTENGCFLKVQDLIFNLSAVLKAQVCFEQISFTPHQLNTCLQLLNLKEEKIQWNSYHPAEIFALRVWEGEKYTQINAFLRDDAPLGPIPEAKVMHYLLIVALAAHALHRPFTTREKNKDVYRGEDLTSDNKFVLERKQACTNKELIIHKGFTATSSRKKSATLFGDSLTYFHIPGGVNSPAKNITHLITNWSWEFEVLIPPSTDILYQNSQYGWRASLFMAINRENDYCYVHSLSAEQTQRVANQLKCWDGLSSSNQQEPGILPDIENTLKNYHLKRACISAVLATGSAALCYKAVQSSLKESESDFGSNLIILITVALISGLIAALLTKFSGKHLLETKEPSPLLYETQSQSPGMMRR